MSELKPTTAVKTRRRQRAAILAVLAIAATGAGAMAAYAHGQQGDDCPKGSTDPDCQKK